MDFDTNQERTHPGWKRGDTETTKVFSVQALGDQMARRTWDDVTKVVSLDAVRLDDMARRREAGQVAAAARVAPLRREAWELEVTKVGPLPTPPLVPSLVSPRASRPKRRVFARPAHSTPPSVPPPTSSRNEIPPPATEQDGGPGFASVPPPAPGTLRNELLPPPASWDDNPTEVYVPDSGGRPASGIRLVVRAEEPAPRTRLGVGARLFALWAALRSRSLRLLRRLAD